MMDNITQLKENEKPEIKSLRAAIKINKINILTQ